MNQATILTIGLAQSGIKLTATASAFESLPPEHWQAFKLQVMEAGKAWGLKISITDHPSITDAQTRFWQAKAIQDGVRQVPDGG